MTNCYVNVLRDAMAVDSLEPCGVYFGTTNELNITPVPQGTGWEKIEDFPGFSLSSHANEHRFGVLCRCAKI